MSINACTINNCSINLLCAGRRSAILANLKGKKTAFGASVTSVSQNVFAPQFSPVLDRISINLTFDGTKYTQDVQITPQTVFVVGSNLSINGDNKLTVQVDNLVIADLSIKVSNLVIYET